MRTPDRIVRFATALAVAALVGGAGSAHAQMGSEGRGSGADLECVVSDRWVGGERGGYWPVRIALTNRGAARSVTVAFLPYDLGRDRSRAPSVTRTLALPAGASTRFTLPLPLIADRGDGALVFVVDPLPEDGVVVPDRRNADDLYDNAVPGLTYEVHPPSADTLAIRGPATLILEGTVLERRSYFEATRAAVAYVESVGGRSTGRESSTRRPSPGISIPPDDLPETWLGFTTVDLVVADPTRLAELSERARQALRDWVHAGGTLAVTEAWTDEETPLSPGVQRLLGLDAGVGAWRRVTEVGFFGRARAVLDAWDSQQTSDYRRGPGPFGRGRSFERDAGIESFDFEEAFNEVVEEAAGDDLSTELADAGEAARPRRRAFGGGRVYALPAGGGSLESWAAVMADLGADRLNVADRFGVGGRGPNEEFLEFLIPGVRGVPVGALVALITLFVLAIGPVNYLILRRRHQVGRLALTVPLVAAGTSATLFAYSTVMHGFEMRARQLAVTVHDPGLDRATEWARTAAFSPHGSQEGLTFPVDAAVFPLAPPGPGARGGRIDWTNGQTWSGAAFESRTRTQFVTVTPRAERGRLTVDRPERGADDRREVVNGYDRDFALMVYTDESGRVFHGADVPAGGRATLRPMSGDDLFVWRERLDPLLPEPLPGREVDGDSLTGEFAPMLHSAPNVNASFRVSLPYRTAAALRGLNERGSTLAALRDAPLIPRVRGSFVALLKEPALTEFGGVPVEADAGVHLLIGRSESGLEPAAASASEPTPAGDADAASVTVRRPESTR